MHDMTTRPSALILWRARFVALREWLGKVPLFLFAGLATRLATLPLIAMTLVIVTLVYPASWVESLLWGSVLVMILTRGPGVFSLDHLIERWFTAREQEVPSFHPART